MSGSRLEAFSDGVLAIIITIMVLELKIPNTDSLAGLYSSLPTILAYVLSFLYVAIYWNNHHHLAKSITRVTSTILWSNMFWLFCISLIPWATAWLNRFYNSVIPVMTYCFVLFITGVAYYIFQNQVRKINNELHAVLGSDYKGKISIMVYLISFLVAPLSPYLSLIGVILVAIIWFIPDQRISKMF
ncbi:putative membrane protein [Streptococcus gallinaceus]|uniref:TMEM175 family protein n=1 Tax=Streptococcus gallinaceus TaxID=165758 RepID=UPI0020A135E6|nr:TMEM175 family protein [Streptococcus gallinaceus]MCP1638916.1 putative membrane protein [Streptococcus gallinaceus]MCP1769840.1 putative membrane protein [Streptococcus gallinaceus]